LGTFRAHYLLIIVRACLIRWWLSDLLLQMFKSLIDFADTKWAPTLARLKRRNSQRMVKTAGFNMDCLRCKVGVRQWKMLWVFYLFESFCDELLMLVWIIFVVRGVLYSLAEVYLMEYVSGIWWIIEWTRNGWLFIVS
jgi:hypothetical protein